MLNPSGIRFGSAEIYNIISSSFARNIEDSLCVGQRRPGIDAEEQVLLFIKMRPGHKLSHKVVEEIKNAIRGGLSRRHVPAWVGEIEDIPVRGQRTFSPRNRDLESVISVQFQWEEDRNSREKDCLGNRRPANFYYY